MLIIVNNIIITNNYNIHSIFKLSIYFATYVPMLGI